MSKFIIKTFLMEKGTLTNIPQLSLETDNKAEDKKLFDKLHYFAMHKDYEIHLEVFNQNETYVYLPVQIPDDHPMDAHSYIEEIEDYWDNRENSWR